MLPERRVSWSTIACTSSTNTYAVGYTLYEARSIQNPTVLLLLYRLYATCNLLSWSEVPEEVIVLVILSKRPCLTMKQNYYEIINCRLRDLVSRV